MHWKPIYFLGIFANLAEIFLPHIIHLNYIPSPHYFSPFHCSQCELRLMVLFFPYIPSAASLRSCR